MKFKNFIFTEFDDSSVTPRKVLLKTPSFNSSHTNLVKNQFRENKLLKNKEDIVKEDTVKSDLKLEVVKESEKPAASPNNTTVDPSDLEDISPERESLPDPDPEEPLHLDPEEPSSDPFSDFVPDPAEPGKEEDSLPESVKEPEFENFSPDPPAFEENPTEKEELVDQVSEEPKEETVEESFEPIVSPVTETDQFQETRPRHKKEKKRKKKKKHKSCSDKETDLGSPISSGPEPLDTSDSPLVASPISSGEDTFGPVISSPPLNSEHRHRGPRTPPALGPHTPPARSGPRTPPPPASTGPRTPPIQGPRTPPTQRTPLQTGPRTPPAPSGPRTPPEPPSGPRTPPDPGNMSDQRRYSKSRHDRDSRSPDHRRHRSDTPEGADARGLTPEMSDRPRPRSPGHRSPPNNGNKRRRDSDWDSVEPKRRKSRDRSRDRGKRDRRSRDRSPGYRDRSPGYRDRSPGYRDRTPSYRDRSPPRDRSPRTPPSRARSPARVSSDRKMSRSHKSRSRSPRSRSPRSRGRDSSVSDTSLFAEMRKKKHLRDKLEARDLRKNKRDDYDENSQDMKMSGSKSDRGEIHLICFMFIIIICSDRGHGQHQNGSSVRLQTPDRHTQAQTANKARPKNLPGNNQSHCRSQLFNQSQRRTTGRTGDELGQRSSESSISTQQAGEEAVQDHASPPAQDGL